MIICLSFQFLCLSFYLSLLHYPKPCLVCSSNNHGYPYFFLILKKNASKIYPLSLTFAIGFGRKAFIRLRAFLSINWLLFRILCCLSVPGPSPQGLFLWTNYRSHHIDIRLGHVTFFGQRIVKGDDICHLPGDTWNHHVVLPQLSLCYWITTSHIAAAPPAGVPEWRIQRAKI